MNTGIRRRKVCQFCADKDKTIEPAPSDTCAMHQRAVAKAIKRARVVALLPFDADQ